jgi:hypothetical protein
MCRRIGYPSCLHPEKFDVSGAQCREAANWVRSKLSKLAVMLDAADPDVLAYIACPEEHRT